MRLRSFLKRKRPVKDKIIDLLFVFTGTQFYMNWILPTNPQSKNPVIKFLWGKKAKKKYCKGRYKERKGLAIGFIFIHAVGIGLYLFVGHKFLGLNNILVNIYPILVNSYILYRCIQLEKLYDRKSKTRQMGNDSRYRMGLPRMSEETQNVYLD